MSAPMANPYQTPAAELTQRPAMVVQSPILRFLLATALGTVVGLASGGFAGAVLTTAWHASPFHWTFGVFAGLLLGGVGGAIAGAVLGPLVQTNVSRRAVGIVGGVIGTLWAGLFGFLGSIPMETSSLTALGTGFSALVGGSVAVALTLFLRRQFG